MRCDVAAAAFRHLDNRRDFLLCERRRRLALRAPAIVRVYLDEIDAVPELVPDDADEIVVTIRGLGAERHVHPLVEAFRPVAAGRDDRLAGNEQCRARDYAFRDRVTDADVCITGAFGSQVAHRRHAGAQRIPHVIDRTGDAFRLGLLQDLVVPASLVVRVQKDVRMTLDQAR